MSFPGLCISREFVCCPYCVYVRPVLNTSINRRRVHPPPILVFCFSYKFTHRQIVLNDVQRYRQIFPQRNHSYSGIGESDLSADNVSYIWFFSMKIRDSHWPERDNFVYVQKHFECVLSHRVYFVNEIIHMLCFIFRFLKLVETNNEIKN